VRWEWIDSNPAEGAKKPRLRAPRPNPPSTVDAARLVKAAWQTSPDLGMFVCLVFVTGMRRAEAVALRWSRLDLKSGKALISRNWVELTGRGGKEKDTKSHQERELSRIRPPWSCLRSIALGTNIRLGGSAPSDDAFVFCTRLCAIGHTIQAA